MVKEMGGYPQPDEILFTIRASRMGPSSRSGPPLLARHLVHRSAQGGWGLRGRGDHFCRIFRRLPSKLEGCHGLQLAIFDITRQSVRRRRAAVWVQRCTETPQRGFVWSFADR